MRKLQTNENIDLNYVFLLTEEQAKNRYSIGRSTLLKIADEAGAVVKIGCQKKNYSREVLDDYFRRHTG